MHPDQPNTASQSVPPAPPPMQPGVVPPGNPYDFILKDAPKKKRSLLPGGNSKTQRIIIIGVIIAVVLTLGIVLFASLSASSSAGTTEMITAAQQQEEIARIADLANQKARKTETKNIAILSVETMRSDQATLVAFLKKNGKKVSNKELSAGKSTQTDAALTQADQANHFDDTLTTTLAKEVADYQSTIKNAHDHTSSANGKKILEQMYTNAATLSDKLRKLTSSQK